MPHPHRAAAAAAAAFLALLPALVACQAEPAAAPPPAAPPPAVDPTRSPFPSPARPVAGIVASQYSDEASRDREGEAETVLRLVAIAPGQTVADIGAGSGYYTMRLSPAVGPSGRVFATDIIPTYLDRLARRVKEAGLTNVQLILGDPDNARLPPASTDTVLMVHMYHEIAEPYALLWHLHDSLRTTRQPDDAPPNAADPADGSAPRAPILAIIDSDRPTSRHGTPPALLRCELAASGYRETGFHRLPDNSYLATFTPSTRPNPEDIQPCPAG
jgi:SAM-dependent methyltransferase